MSFTITNQLQNDLKSKIRDVHDFPKPGIIFKDVTTLLSDALAFNTCIDALSELSKPFQPTKIIGIEARGFIFAACVAYKLKVGFIPVRKMGKLPYLVEKESYALEYGTDTLEIHKDSLSASDNVIIVDDVLATGGTILATYNLIRKLNAKVSAACMLIELTFLQGNKKLPPDVNLISLLNY